MFLPLFAGLDTLSDLTSQGSWELRVNMEKWDGTQVWLNNVYCLHSKKKKEQKQSQSKAASVSLLSKIAGKNPIVLH
jgi:hypothetical protein